MYEFLDKLDTNKIKENVLHGIQVTSWKSLLRLDRETTYSILFGIYGYDLLSEKKIRILLLQTLSDQEISDLADRVGIRKKGKPFDLCVYIGNIPWRSNSRVVWEFARIFSVPNEYLPSGANKNEAIELIEPYSPPSDLFDFQIDIVNQIMEIFALKKRKAFLVQLPTGAGKTRTVIESIINFYNKTNMGNTVESILWLAHTEELCEQAIDTFRDVWQAKGLNEIRVVRLWGEYNPMIQETMGAFIVGSFQKLYSIFNKSREDFNGLTRQLRFVIVDEAHKTLAPTYKELIENIYIDREIYLIGLTATPGRSKEDFRENIDLATIFEKTLVTSKQLRNGPIKILQEKGILSKINRVVYESKVSSELSEKELDLAQAFRDFPVSVLKRLAGNNTRNELIVMIVSREIEKGNKCLVFSCSIGHAKTLSILSGMNGIRSAYISYDMRRNLRRRIIQEFRNDKIDVIFNYGILSTGFDVPNVRTIVIARPTTSIVLYSQMIGRGLRGPRMGGTELCNLVDIKDNFLNFGVIDEVYKYFDEYWT